MIHEMKLRQEPFDKIINREKTVELRLFDEKRQLIKAGDRIRFSLVDKADKTIEATVIELHRFSSFKELFLTGLFSECGCGGMTVEEAVKSMRRYYTKEQEEKYGVLGIEIVID